MNNYLNWRFIMNISWVLTGLMIAIAIIGIVITIKVKIDDLHKKKV